ncbi:hypothetical protein KP509_29G050800 [Ceratopteris richardii]|nr:hypothetical protein KP509_29G050800 [Ceratopteris richardii]
MERDKAISALTIICNNGNDREGAAKLLEVVNFFANRNHVGNNMLALPSPVEELGSQGDEHAIERHGKYLSKGGKKEIANMKRKANVATSQEHSRKKKKQQRSEGKVQKSKLGAICKSLLASVPPYDLASTPVPLCSCTGTNRQCYRWGSGGWQSSCCTTFLSAYPLPLYHARRNSRVAGRKMSGGAFKKLLDRLAETGVDITQPVDLKNHWAKHGTNKYVIVK